MNNDLDVYHYSMDDLREIISKSSSCNTVETISNKTHDNYLQSYLKDQGVKTLIVEHDYIDHDYLEDYASYYVRCFSDKYKRKCTRIHFFKNNFSKNELLECLASYDANTEFHNDLQKNYLGFTVIKPLPLSIIGRTCLATYPEIDGRKFPVIREYKVNICGIELSVKSLAFQEQDSTVAACATSALWSIFQGTGKKFQHKILSPIEITKAATDKLPYNTRTLPSDGLSFEMIAQGIRHVGLEPFAIKVDEFWLKANLYAYLKGKIPILLGIQLYDIEPPSPESMGLHAAAVTGFKLDTHTVPKNYEGKINLRSSKIDTIYAHDDQVGPFARMVFGETIEVGSNKQALPTLTTSWKNTKKKENMVCAVPLMVTIPLYGKIRIPFNSIYNKTEKLNIFLNFIFVDNVIVDGVFTDKLQIEWDIYLTTNNEYKSTLYKSDINGEYYREVLLSNMPKYIWCSTAYLDGEKVFDLLFDATDVKNGSCFTMAVSYNNESFNDICEICKQPEVSNIASVFDVANIASWFKNNKI